MPDRQKSDRPEQEAAKQRLELERQESQGQGQAVESIAVDRDIAQDDRCPECQSDRASPDQQHRGKRIECGQSQPIWARCLSLGINVVLDYGFWSRAERDRVRAVVAETGATFVLWDVSCSDDEARKRIALRNEAAHRSLYIAPATFDLLKARVEPLDIDEPHAVA